MHANSRGIRFPNFIGRKNTKQTQTIKSAGDLNRFVRFSDITLAPWASATRQKSPKPMQRSSPPRGDEGNVRGTFVRDWAVQEDRRSASGVGESARKLCAAFSVSKRTVVLGSVNAGKRPVAGADFDLWSHPQYQMGGTVPLNYGCSTKRRLLTFDRQALCFYGDG